MNTFIKLYYVEIIRKNIRKHDIECLILGINPNLQIGNIRKEIWPVNNEGQVEVAQMKILIYE